MTIWQMHKNKKQWQQKLNLLNLQLHITISPRAILSLNRNFYSLVSHLYIGTSVKSHINFDNKKISQKVVCKGCIPNLIFFTTPSIQAPIDSFNGIIVSQTLSVKIFLSRLPHRNLRSLTWMFLLLFFMGIILRFVTQTNDTLWCPGVVSYFCGISFLGVIFFLFWFIVIFMFLFGFFRIVCFSLCS